MSLTVPITTADMSSGVTGYAPVSNNPPSMSATSSVVGGGTPVFGAQIGTPNNNISFGAAGWIAFGVILIYLLDRWGFRFAHVPV